MRRGYLFGLDGPGRPGAPTRSGKNPGKFRPGRRSLERAIEAQRQAARAAAPAGEKAKGRPLPPPPAKGSAVPAEGKGKKPPPPPPLRIVKPRAPDAEGKGKKTPPPPPKALRPSGPAMSSFTPGGFLSGLFDDGLGACFADETPDRQYQPNGRVWVAQTEVQDRKSVV